MKPSNIDKLELLHPDIVFNFLETGRSSGIPAEMQTFIKQLQWSSEIWETQRNITRAAKKLRERIMANQNVKLNINTCKARVYQAMEYFDVDHNVAQEIWDRNAADKFEDLASLAIKQNKLDAAGRFIKEANELRRKANSALNINELQMPVFLIDTKLNPEDLGYDSQNMLDISKKASDGFYYKFIMELDASKEDKKRLLKDADIEDIDFEEIQ